jgi:hypothetical protein
MLPRVPKEIVALFMLATMAHWAWSYGVLIYGLATYVLQKLLGLP